MLFVILSQSSADNIKFANTSLESAAVIALAVIQKDYSILDYRGEDATICVTAKMTFPRFFYSFLAGSVSLCLFVCRTTSLILFTFYSADLTSRFTAISEQTVLKTFGDAVTHQFKVFVPHESIARSILKNAPLESGLHRIQEEIVSKNEVLD